MKKLLAWATRRKGKPVPPAQDANSSIDSSDWIGRDVRYQPADAPPPLPKGKL